MRHAYHIENLTDLTVIREQALERTKPNNRFSTQAETSVVHFHKKEDACDNNEANHEIYPAEKG